MKILKYSSIVLGGVVGIVGIILLVLFFTGKFNEPVYNPEDIFFAEKVTLEDGSFSYQPFENNYYESENFQMILSTNTEVVNKTKVELYFNTKNDIVKYVKENNETLTPAYRAVKNNSIVNFSVCNKDEAEYVTNGKIIVPITINLNKYFEVLLCVAPDDMNATINESTKFYNVGGATTIYAKSENREITDVSKQIYIDVPVSELNIISITSNGGEESVLTKNGEFYIVNLETYFGAIAQFVPQRSAFKFGNESNKKTVVFYLANDEQNIAFVNSEGTVLTSKISANAKMFSLLAGDANVYAKVFKNSLLENANSNLTTEQMFEALNTSNSIQASTAIKVSSISIDGFEIDEELSSGSKEVSFEVNKELIFSANGVNPNHINLGIEISAEGFSEGAIQNEIKNMFLSIQVLTASGYVDATKTVKLFEVLDSNKFTVTDENSRYNGFDFYEIKFNKNEPNNSFWKVVALSGVEDAGSIKIVIGYKNENQIVENSNYGPFEINGAIEEPINAQIVWNNTDLKLSSNLPVGETNEKVMFVSNGVYNPIAINLTNLTSITNLNENLTYSLIKFFIYSTDDALDSKINCKKYGFEIAGVPSMLNDKPVYIYEISSAENLIINSMGNSASFEFNIFYALVKHDRLASPILKADGSYEIIKVSENTSNILVYIPIKISKIVDLSNDSISYEAIKTTDNKLLQRTKDNVKLTIKIKAEDFEIFKSQVLNNNIYLSSELDNNLNIANSAFYLYADSRAIALKDVLFYIVENESFLPAGITITEEEGYKVVTITLSTGAIEYADNEVSKPVRINLNYYLNSENLPAGTSNIIVKQTGEINIYSGKISEFFFNVYKKVDGTIFDNEILPVENGDKIIIESSIDDTNTLTTKYYLIKNGTSNKDKIEIKELTKLNIGASTQYGINDTILASFADSSIVNINENNEISILKAGTTNLTIKPAYPADVNAQIVVTFEVSMNYSLDANDLDKRNDYVNNNNANGVLSYDVNNGYTFIGAPVKDGTIVDSDGRTYNFADLVGLYLITGDHKYDISTSLSFSVVIDEDLLEFVTIDAEGGFSIKGKLGVPASFIVYYFSNDYNFNSGVLKINLAPYYKANANINNHEGAEIDSNAGADTKFVFAEAEVDLSSFDILKFNLSNKTYETASDFAAVTFNGVFFEGSSFYSNGITFRKNNEEVYISNIVFDAVSEPTIKTITIKTDSTRLYDFAVTYTFYVYPNIQLSSSNEFKGEEVEDGVTYHYLNTPETAYKNGDSITWGVAGEPNPTIIFERIYTPANAFIWETTLMEVSGATQLSLKTLTISYGGKEFNFKYYAEPNISIAESIKTVTYNGETYLSLYAGQNVSSLTNAKFGSLINETNTTIKSVNELQELAKVNSNVFGYTYKLFGGSNITITKDDNGLFITHIVFEYGSSYIVRKAIIFPAEWSYLNYYKDATESDKTDPATIDISKLSVEQILSGKVAENDYASIPSGKTITDFASILNNKNVISYKIYNITNNTLIYDNSSDSNAKNIDFIELKYNSDNKYKWQIDTKPSGKTYTYRIDFIVPFTQTGYDAYNYEFSYYLTLTKTQTITVNYPYGGSSHKVYYSEFNNGEFELDLQRITNNLQGEQYVVVKNNDSPAENATLKFEIEQVFVNSIEQSNYANLVKITEDGVLTITSTTADAITVKIRVFTPADAEATYVVDVVALDHSYYIGTETTGSDPKTYNIFGLTEINAKTNWPNDTSPLFETDSNNNKYINLSNFKLLLNTSGSYSPVTGNKTLKFAFLNDAGILQTESNLIYVDNDTTKLIVKPSPQKLSGYLYAYTAEDGIIAKIKVTIDSPIVVTQTNATEIKAGQNIDLTKYISIKVNGGTPSEEINYKFEQKNGNEVTNYSNYSIPSTNESYQLEFSVKIWGMSGTSADNCCTLDLRFTITPNVVLKEQTEEVWANTSNEEITIVGSGKTFELTGDEGFATISSITVKGVDLSNLSEEERSKFPNLSANNYGFAIGGESYNLLTFTTGPVAANRVVVVTLELTTSDGKTFTSSVKITIKPDTEVEINYPDYETNQNLEYHIINWDDWVGQDLTIIGDDKFAYWKCAKHETTCADTHTIELKSNSSDLYSLTTNNTSVKLENSASKPTQDFNIVLHIYVDGIFRENYIVRVRISDVFVARFDNNNNTKTESLIYSTSIGSEKLLDLVDGTFSVKALANRSTSSFKITLFAIDTRTNVRYEVALFGKGREDNEEGLTPLYENSDCSTAYPSATQYVYNLKTLFNDKYIKDYLDVCEIGYEIVENNGVIANAQSVKLTLPSARLSFFFNGVKIPFKVADTMFEVGTSAAKLSEFTLGSISANTPRLVSIKSNSTIVGTSREVASYTVTLVKDYAFGENTFDEITNSGTTSGKANESYDAGEFEGYIKSGETPDFSSIKISKTIELTAEESYNLISLLKNHLNLTALNGGAYQNLQVKLDYGKYNTNINYKNNISSLISLQEVKNGSDIVDYTITPNGAKNGGDIVHLVLNFGTNASDPSAQDTFILRIKILPKAEITLVDPSGTKDIAYGEAGGSQLVSTKILGDTTGTDDVYNIPLSNLVRLKNIEPNEIIVSVGNGSEYVVGSGLSNRLGVLPTDNVYGIQLRKTIFGGNVIELTISDRFGLSVKLNIIYSNKDETAPSLISSPTSIYEGESFTLAFYIGQEENTDNGGTIEAKYVVFDGSWKIAFESDFTSADFSYTNIIKIDNFDKDVLKGLLVDNSGGIIADDNLTGYSLTSGVDNAFAAVSANFISNTHFEGGISISADNLSLKLVLKTTNSALGSGFTETVEINIPTALNQRYQVRVNEPYSKYSALYFGLGRTFNFTDLFYLYDLKENKNAASSNLLSFESIEQYLKNDSNEYDWRSATNYTSTTLTFTTKYSSLTLDNKLTEIAKTKFKMKVNDIEHELEFEVYFTPKYYQIKLPTSYDSAYGVVVDGDASSTSSNFDSWAAGFELLDYYGEIIGASGTTLIGGAEETTAEETTIVSFEKVSGTGDLNGSGNSPTYQLTSLSADSPVTIAVKCNNVEIGTIVVTMRRYYALTGGGTSEKAIGTTNILDFGVWANGIKALVAGGTTSEALPSGLSNFTFKAATSGYDIQLINGEYNLRKFNGTFASDDEIVVVVSYLNKQLGAIRVFVNSDKKVVVAVVDLNFNTATTPSSVAVEYDETNGTDSNKKIDFKTWASSIRVSSSDAPNASVSLFAVSSLFDYEITTTSGFKFDDEFNIVKTDGSAFTKDAANSIGFKLTYKKSDGSNTEITCNANFVFKQKYASLAVTSDEISYELSDTILEDVWAGGITLTNQLKAESEILKDIDKTNFTFILSTDYEFAAGTHNIVKSELAAFESGNKIEITIKYYEIVLGTVEITVGDNKITLSLKTNS